LRRLSPRRLSLGKWFGADSTMLDTQVFKTELANFALKDLGFMR
jgi:hypothetical protein